MSTVVRCCTPKCLHFRAFTKFLHVDNKKCSTGKTGSDIIGQNLIPSIEHLRNPRLNKGLAFTHEERQKLGIAGLQPISVRTQQEQADLVLNAARNLRSDLSKYMFMTELHERNEKLFYMVLTEHISDFLPVVYTPTVGLVCQKFGMIYRKPRGLFITIKDRHHVHEILRNWPEPQVQAIVVTDGERILGLGDLGANGMAIPVGKMSLYTALAGIKPYHCLPILLDVGTNNERLLTDPFYVGLRQKRAVGDEYDAFVEEFINACIGRYGQHVLIQFEDFGRNNAARLLEMWRNRICTFNDDIQGTAAVVLSGLYASNRITGIESLADHKFLFLGAGAAATGIAELIVKAMEKDGLDTEEGRERIWMFDLDGLVTVDRAEGVSDANMMAFAKDHPHTTDLRALVEDIKPSVLIGTSTQSGAFSPEILQAMARFHERPIILALSNPTSNAECTAEEAYQNTEGRCVYASGSPFDPVEYGGKTFHPGQSNNAYTFPGVALGVILTGMHHICEDVFLIAAEVVAQEVSDEDIERGRVYPPLSSLYEVSIKLAVKIFEYAYETSQATLYPEPEDYEAYIRSKQYNYCYLSELFHTWKMDMPEPPLPVRSNEEAFKEYREAREKTKFGGIGATDQ